MTQDPHERQVAARQAGVVGRSAQRPDGTLKVTGQFAYSSDPWLARPRPDGGDPRRRPGAGGSSNRSTNNVLHVDAILRRAAPLLIDVEGGNTAEHLNLARIPRESEMAEKLMARFPGVTALHYPTSGTHFHCYVALRQRRPGQARQVMLGLLGWDAYVKTVIAVDDDVDVTDDGDVLWALATHFQPHRDLSVVDGLPGSPLDPSSGSDGTTSRMGLDAARGPDFHGDRIVVSDTARAAARRLLAPTGGTA